MSKKNPFINLAGLVLFSMGIGMALSALVPGIGLVLAIVMLSAGGYILFVL